MFKKSNIATQYNFAFFIAFVLLLLAFNWIFYQYKHEQHRHSQQHIAETILDNLAIELEYGIFIGSQEQLKNIISPLKDNPEIAAITIYDNQNNTLAAISNKAELNILESEKLNQVAKEIIQRSNIDIGEDPFLSEQALEQLAVERKLGEVIIELIPLNIASPHYNSYQILFNCILIGLFLTLWFYVIYKQNSVKTIIRHLISSLNNSELSKELQPLIQTTQGNLLTKAVANKILYAKHLEHQLNLLKKEVNEARLDGNSELQEFIGFLRKNPIESSDSRLTLFYQAISEEVSKNKTAVWLKDIVKQTLTNYSTLADQHNVIVHDHYSGDRLNHKALLDDHNFRRFVTIVLEQLILICENSNLTLSLDQRNSYQSNTLLRISIESDSEQFKQAISHQSLFQFNEQLAISNYCNNMQLISAKHLLRKLGGEYFYFENEIRFEMPISTIEHENVHHHEAKIVPISKHMKALVFDSDPVDKMVLMGYLDKLGLKTDKATTKQVVLQKIRHESFDFIMVNSEFLRDSDPFFFGNLVSELKHIDNRLKVLVVSSDDTVKNHPMFRKLQAVYVAKPLDVEELRAILLEQSSL
ncbi:MAG: response regulator receiver protein [Kangiellaceae bacterium]|nr:response regulator receiver protein [Kangiellaceae bacterium]